jgi:hypothetical protein
MRAKQSQSFAIKQIPSSWLRIILLLLFSVVLVAFFQGKTIKATGASLSVFPQTGSFTMGNTFEVSVFMNTGENNVSAAKVELKFDPEKLQVVTPTKGISVIGEWIFPPSFSNTKGTITFQGGFLFNGINTSEGLISTVVFEAISQGETEIYFLDSSKVLIAKEGGINILSSVNRGVYNILPAPFRGPQIFSETHSDQNKWYKNNSPTFSWKKIDEAEGYSYRLDDDPYGEPNNIIDAQVTSISFEDIGDGAQFFHLKGKKDGIWGGTSHFKILIDKTLPLEFRPYLESFTFTSANDLLVYFDTTDLLSGIDKYEIRITDLTNPQDIVFSGWIRQESPFRLTREKAGTFEVIIRAFDKAGNFREGKIQIKVIGSILILVDDGIQIRGVFFPWWQIYSLIIITLLGIGFLIFKLLKSKREGIRISLQKEIKEAEKEIEDVKIAQEKLRKLRTKEEEAGKKWKQLKESLEKEIKSPPNQDKTDAE